MGRKYHSDICMGIHESMKELLDIGAISEVEMREFDELCFEEEGETRPKPEFSCTESEPLEMGRVTVNA